MPVPAGYQLESPTPRPAPQAQAVPTGSSQPGDDSAPPPVAPQQPAPLSRQASAIPESIQKIYAGTASAPPAPKFDSGGSFLPGIYEHVASKVEQSGLPGAAAWADNYRMQKRAEIAGLLEKESKNSSEFTKAQMARYSQLHGGIEEWSKGLNSEQQRASAWPQMLSQMEARGLVKPGEADAIGLGAYPGDAGLEHVLNGLAAHNEVSQYGLKSAEAREKNLQADEYASPAAATARQSTRDEATAKAQAEQLKLAEQQRENVHSGLASAALRGLPALTQAYDKLTDAQRERAPNPHEMDASKYEPNSTASNIAFSGLSLEKQEAALHAHEQLEQAGSEAGLARIANDSGQSKQKRDDAKKALDALTDNRIKRAVSTARAAQEALYGGTPGPAAPPTSGPVKGARFHNEDPSKGPIGWYSFSGSQWVKE